MKLEIIWLMYHIDMDQIDGPNINSRIRLKQFEKNFDLQLKSQNCLDLANLMIKVKDYKSAKKLLKKSKERIMYDDKLQWTIYYMMSLKFAARTLNPQLFYNLLKEWEGSSLQIMLLSRNKNQINSYIKYFSKNWMKIKQDTSIDDKNINNLDNADIDRQYNTYKDLEKWHDSVRDILEQIKDKDKKRRLKIKQDIEIMLDSVQQWIDQAVLENYSYRSSK